MWNWLISLIGAPVINGLISAYKAKLDAANTKDRIAADLAAREIEAEIEARKGATAVLIGEQGRWYTAIIRPLLALARSISSPALSAIRSRTRSHHQLHSIGNRGTTIAAIARRPNPSLT